MRQAGTSIEFRKRRRPPERNCGADCHRRRKPLLARASNDESAATSADLSKRRLVPRGSSGSKENKSPRAAGA